MSETRFPTSDVNIVENVATVSTLNSKTNLLGSQVWLGTFESIVNQSAIQLISKFDQDVTIYIDQGQDGVNADVTDTWNSYANTGFAISVTSVAPYYRVRLTNKSTTASTGQMTSAMTAILNTLPRTLDADGHLETVVNHITGDMGTVRISPMGALKEASSTRLVGTAFIGTTVDSNFWVTPPTIVGSGAVSQIYGEMTLTTGITANSSVLQNSVRSARYVVGNPNYYRGNLNLPVVTTGAGGHANVRRWGAFNASDGYFFQATQTNPATTPTLAIVCRKTDGAGTNDSPVNSGSFNGNGGASYALDNNCHTYEIWWSNKTAYFFIDDVLIHKVTSSLTTAVSTPTLPVGLQTINSGGNTSANRLVLRSSIILKLGQLLTLPNWKYMTGVSTAILKYSAGNLHGLVIGAVPTSGAVVTLYDALSALNPIASFSLIFPGGGNFVPVSIDFKGLPFFTGLYVAITVQTATITVIYE